MILFPPSPKDRYCRHKKTSPTQVRWFLNILNLYQKWFLASWDKARAVLANKLLRISCIMSSGLGQIVSCMLSLPLCLYLCVSSFLSLSVCLRLSPPTISSLSVISTVLRIRLCKEAAVKPPQINLCATDGGYCRCQQLLKVQIADRCGVFSPKRDNYITYSYICYIYNSPRLKDHLGKSSGECVRVRGQREPGSNSVFCTLQDHYTDEVTAAELPTWDVYKIKPAISLAQSSKRFISPNT